MPVFDAVGLIGSGPQAGLSVRLIFGVIAVKQKNVALPFKGQDMGGDPVQKPAVVADDHGAPAEILQGLFQRPHGIDIQIIGRFIQQKHIGPFL